MSVPQTQKPFSISLVFLIFFLFGSLLTIAFASQSLNQPQKPTTDFVYTMVYDPISCDDYDYYVDNNLLKREKRPVLYCKSEIPGSKLYYHDVTQNKSREISFVEAQNLKFDNSEQSPDGFMLKIRNDSPPFLNTTFNMYLIKDSQSLKQNLSLLGNMEVYWVLK